VAKRGERDRERGRRDGGDPTRRGDGAAGGRSAGRYRAFGVRPCGRGRATAIDRDAAGIDPDARETTAGTEGDETESGDEIRWQVNVVVTGESSESDESSKSGESSGSGGTEAPPAVDGIRAGDRLVAAVAGSELVALDAETGERALASPRRGRMAGTAPPTASRSTAKAWVAVESEGEGEVDGGSEEPVATLVRFGPSGERRAERSVSVDVDWLVAVDETLVVGSAAGER